MTKPYITPGFDVDDRPPPPPITRVTKPVTVVLRGVRVPLTSDVGAAFISDCSRNRERIFSDAQLQEKYEIDPNDWDSIVKNKPLRLAISRECERRMLNNDAAREGAAKQFTKAPAVLGGILEDQKANPRHRIEAAKELRSAARAGDDQPSNEVDRLHIVINLGGDERVVVDAPVNPTPPRGSSDAETEW